MEMLIFRWTWSKTKFLEDGDVDISLDVEQKAALGGWKCWCFNCWYFIDVEQNKVEQKEALGGWRCWYFVGRGPKRGPGRMKISIVQWTWCSNVFHKPYGQSDAESYHETMAQKDWLTPAYTYGRGDTSRIPGTSAPWATVGIALEPGWPPKNDLRYGATHICGKLDTDFELGGPFGRAPLLHFSGPGRMKMMIFHWAWNKKKLWALGPESKNVNISLYVEQTNAPGGSTCCYFIILVIKVTSREQKC